MPGKVISLISGASVTLLLQNNSSLSTFLVNFNDFHHFDMIT
jgi:hypothetical protein